MVRSSILSNTFKRQHWIARLLLQPFEVRIGCHAASNRNHQRPYPSIHPSSSARVCYRFVIVLSAERPHQNPTTEQILLGAEIAECPITSWTRDCPGLFCVCSVLQGVPSIPSVRLCVRVAFKLVRHSSNQIRRSPVHPTRHPSRRPPGRIFARALIF